MIYQCQIIENTKVSQEVHKIKISIPGTNKIIRPGMFFNIKCSSENYPLLRRPISIALVEDESLTFYIRRAGRGTEIICNKKAGEYLDIMGPLGNGFDISLKDLRVLVVGGGIGVAPLLQLTKELSTNQSIVLDVILGFKDEAIIINEYKKYVNNIIVVSENRDEYNYRGFVTKPLKYAIERNDYDIIYTCGPKAMLKAVKEIAEVQDISTQILMEERMACGMGACLVCTCKVTNEEDWKYVRTCKEGPVFYSREVIFDE